MKSLAKGQSIKQFEAYSIAESLASRPFDLLSTTIPCDGGIPWTLEPPLFHSLGALGIRMWPSFPALIPILCALALFLALFRLLEHAKLNLKNRTIVAVGVTLCPALARFGIQFIPDPLAATFLILGIDSFLRKKRNQGTLYFAMAVLTKALMGTAVAGILLYDILYLNPEPRRCLSLWFKTLIRFSLSVAPFLLWVIAVKIMGTSSVLHQGGLLENFLLRGWDIFLTRNYYSKFLLWVVIRGAGWVLSLSAICLFILEKGNLKTRSPFEALLWIWFLGVIPHWFFIRQGNQVHDYYSLSFVIPLALLGMLALLRLEDKKRGWGIALILFSIANGIGSLAEMKPVAYDPAIGRPYFCGTEMRPASMMKLPPGTNIVAPFSSGP